MTGTGNWTNYNNPELDKLIDAQALEFDEEKRKEIVLKAERMILPEHGPQLTLTSGIQYAARWNYVDFGPEGAGGFGGPLEEPDPDAEYGPAGTEIRVERG